MAKFDGLTAGMIGWDFARRISKQEKKYNQKMELSHWNYVNTYVWIIIFAVFILFIGVTTKTVEPLIVENEQK